MFLFCLSFFHILPVMDAPHNRLRRHDVTRLISLLSDGVFSALGAKLSSCIYLKLACALLLSNNSTQLPLSPPPPHPRAPSRPSPLFIQLLICERARQIINLAGLFIPRLIFPYLCLGGRGKDDGIETSSRS